MEHRGDGASLVPARGPRRQRGRMQTLWQLLYGSYFLNREMVLGQPWGEAYGTILAAFSDQCGTE